ncbi:MerR family transcriptional regulator [Aliagarivorans marinus]|uniref:MerR family transcriptional regulator n=2 Tax=Aliagarivorans TaxID=882379 RepID=UPI0003FD411F|nr:MerR family transcriptional regulator [Aliagarivorans marinus]
MITVTDLARRCGISRATLLYYERQGLIAPKLRSANGYRWYGESELTRLQTIVAYRSYGLSVASINSLLNRQASTDQAKVLREHFELLETEISKLREQQRAIVVLLQDPKLLESKMVTKRRWVEIMQAAGFDEAAMTSWHRKFEEMEPEEHQKFLESLGIGESEIAKIRKL